MNRDNSLNREQDKNHENRHRVCRCHAKTLMLVAIALILLTPAASSFADSVDIAIGAAATASSVRSAAYSAANAIDGKMSNESRWLSDPAATGPPTLTITFSSVHSIGCIQVATGWFTEGKWAEAATDFSLDYRNGAAWTPIPGGGVTGNLSNAVEIKLAVPVTTDSIRLTMIKPAVAKVIEVRVYEPASSYPPLVLPITESKSSPIGSVNPPKILVNQIGYDQDGFKRFTSPGAVDGTSFTVETAGGGAPLFRGTIKDQIGDFSAFRPVDSGVRYLIRTSAGASDSFAIGPRLFEDSCLKPALDFMIDDRSVVGTHPSAYGGCPWRDGTYYTYEVPSLVMLYLSDHAYFDSLPHEVDLSADQARVLSPNFKFVRTVQDNDVPATVQAYYQTLDPPADNAPDIVKLIHWGIGWYLVKPTSDDPSGGPDGNIIHAQTVEQFAYFLYGYPQYKHYISSKFYGQAEDFAFNEWGKAGLFDVNTQMGTWKGREAIGHSILPNLLMYEVAKRDGRPEATQFLNAAVKQAAWIVANVDPSDPKLSKGVRMSVHKTITGLTTLLAEYPASAPPGLRDWLGRWTDVVIARSDDLWDFCRYGDKIWELPSANPSDPNGELTNPCGSVIALPACLLAVADVITDQQKALRLKQIATSQFDAIFGRNPLGASYAWRGPKDYPGVVRGWPDAFSPNACARLPSVRGTLNAAPTASQYPDNPDGEFCHPEGWTAYNAAFNVSLAYAIAKNGGLYGK